MSGGVLARCNCACPVSENLKVASTEESVPPSSSARLSSNAPQNADSWLSQVAVASAVGALLLSGASPAMAEVAAASPTELATTAGLVGDSSLADGLLSGFLLIFFSELGDKTFFIALLLALKNPRGAVFIGTFGALAVMTVISVGLGTALHVADELLNQGGASSIPYDDILAAALLVFFGIKTIQEAKDAEGSEEEEKEEAEEAVARLSGEGQAGAAAQTGGALAASQAGGMTALVLSTFALVFAAEWGDKSFLATIALAAASSPLGVTVGAVAGHGAATGLAVAGGSLLSRYVSPIILQYAGGSLFLVFAGVTVLEVMTKLSAPL